MEEGNGEGIPFEEIWDVDVEATFLSVGIGEEAKVGERVAEDFGDWGREDVSC